MSLEEEVFVCKCTGCDSVDLDSLKQKYTEPDTRLRAIVESCGPEKTAQFLGKDAKEQALITQWLTVRNELGDKNAIDALVKDLNVGLSSMAYVASKVHPTLADFCLFYVLHEKKAVKSAMLKSKPHFCRWFDQMQHSKEVRDGLAKKRKLVAFSLSDTLSRVVTITAPVAEKSAGVAEKSAGVAEGKKADGSNNKINKKKEKKKKEKPAPAATSQQKDQPAVTKLDFRVGKIVKAWAHENSEKLYCEEIDLGEEAPRAIASGLRDHYKDASELENRLVLVLCNLKPRSLGGFKSNGMVLCASSADKEKVEFVDPPAGSKIGEKIVFKSIKGGPFEPATANAVSKKKVLEAVAPNLKTNSNREVCWICPNGKEHVFNTTAGVITAPTVAGGSVS